MSRPVIFTVILTTISLLFTGMTYYIISRRISILWINISNKKTILLISLFISISIVVLFLIQSYEKKTISIISSLASRLFMLIPILTILTGIENIIQITVLNILSNNNLFETKIWWLTTLGIFLLLFIYGVYTSFNTRITNVEFINDKISKDINIMLVADIHVDDIISTVHLKEIKKQILEQKPDIVLIAWDLFNISKFRQAEYFKVLTWINTPMFAIEWNHDIMGDIKALDRVWEITNIKFLQNEKTILPEFNIQILWIKEQNKFDNKSNNEVISIKEILEKTNITGENTFNILLTHQPINLKKINTLPIDLELAWHTHNMQIRGLHFISHLVNDYTYWYHILENQKAFITQWIGTRWLPIRWWTKSEIVMLRIKKQNN